MDSILSDFENYCKGQKTTSTIPLKKNEKKKPVVVNNKVDNSVVELSISEESEEDKKETGEMEIPEPEISQKETQDKEENWEDSEIDNETFEKIITNYSKLNNRDRDRIHRIRQQEHKKDETPRNSPRWRGLAGSGLFS